MKTEPLISYGNAFMEETRPEALAKLADDVRLGEAYRAARRARALARAGCYGEAEGAIEVGIDDFKHLCPEAYAARGRAWERVVHAADFARATLNAAIG